jgi:hypothetical protein
MMGYVILYIVCVYFIGLGHNIVSYTIDILCLECAMVGLTYLLVIVMRES